MSKVRHMKRVTMRDIAEKTGFTVNTVSHALKNKPDISEKTKKMIKKTAKEMGYVPNYMASALRSGRSHTLALIVGELGNPKFSAMASDIEAAARKLNYSVIILCTQDDGDLEKRAIKIALERQVDGIILSPTQVNDDCIEILKKAHCPFVLIERYFENHQVDCVICDEENGGYLAGMHLIEKGHRKVIHFMGPEYISSSIARKKGFLQATEDLGKENTSVVSMKSAKENIAFLKKKQKEGYTGAFFFSDFGVWDVIAHLQKEKSKLLNEMAFVGYDNIQGKYSFPSPLCSIDPNSTKLCKATVELLHKRIIGGNHHFTPEKITFPVQLICRKSCEIDK